MADAGPNYKVQRLRLEIQIEELEASIAKGKAHRQELLQRRTLVARKAELTVAEIDDEIRLSEENEVAQLASIKEMRKNLDAMVKE